MLSIDSLSQTSGMQQTRDSIRDTDSNPIFNSARNSARASVSGTVCVTICTLQRAAICATVHLYSKACLGSEGEFYPHWFEPYLCHERGLNCIN